MTACMSRRLVRVSIWGSSGVIAVAFRSCLIAALSVGIPGFAQADTWLYRVATNASLMKYRKRRELHVSLEQSQGPNEDAEPLQLPDWSTPAEQLLTKETREVMEEGIQRLPEDLRTVFVLRDIEELSNAQVAEVLDLSVAAVKSRLHRGRIQLRERLNRYFTDRMTKKDRVR